MNTTTRHPATTGRRAIGALRILLAAAVRYGAITPAAAPTVKQPIPAAITAPPAVEQHAQDPAGLFAADELPPLADIEAAAEKFLQAAEQTRVADRTKRASRKILDRLPAGRHGRFVVEYVDNAREIADLESIRAVFAAHGLGDVPMRRSAPSLKISLAQPDSAAV
jgi:hypothetical protein